ncbi:MAG: catalase [Lachnospiraceae bacterium]|nr:catalase [Lachnospiraceae bacterium]
MDFFGHLGTVLEHKWLVMKYCFKVGLFKQGILHDLSKFSPTEFLVGVKYYQGDRSPNNAEREEKGYSASWLHHKGRNKHHYEYWTDYSVSSKSVAIVPVKMPAKYVVEMLMDRIAASRVYHKGHYKDDMPLKYFARSMDRVMMHEDTKRLLYKLLKMLSIKGEAETFRYIKMKLKGKHRA